MISRRQTFARALAASVLFATPISIDTVQAAGARAAGQCGAYGVAYDYEQVEATTAAALGQCTGMCQLATGLRGSCAALSIEVRNTCGAYGYEAASRLGQAQNTPLHLDFDNSDEIAISTI